MKTESDNKIRRTIIKWGYEYTLVAVMKRGNDHPDPCFMGNAGFALESIKKLK
jgi:hypothetical protein